MKRSTSDPSLDHMFADNAGAGETGGTMGGPVDPMLLQLMAMMNKENQNQNNIEEDKLNQEEQTDAKAKSNTSGVPKQNRREIFEQQINKKKDDKPKLLTRSGSDPQFDNIEYLKKVEDQTIAMLRSTGMEIPEEELEQLRSIK